MDLRNRRTVVVVALALSQLQAMGMMHHTRIGRKGIGQPREVVGRLEAQVLSHGGEGRVHGLGQLRVGISVTHSPVGPARWECRSSRSRRWRCRRAAGAVHAAAATAVFCL